MVLAQRGWRAGRLHRRRPGVRRGERRLAAAEPQPSAPATPRPSRPTRASSPSWGRSPRPARRRCCPSSTGRQAGPLPVISMSSTYLGLDAGRPGRGAGPSRCPLPDRRAQLRPRGARRRRPGRGGRSVRPASRASGDPTSCITTRRGCRRGHGLRHGGDAPGHARRRHGGVGPPSARLHASGRSAFAAPAPTASISPGYAIADNGARLIKDLRGKLRPRLARSWRPTASTSPPRSSKAQARAAEGVVITLSRDPDAEAAARGPALRAGVRAALRRPAVLLLGVHRSGDARPPGRHRGVGRHARRGACATCSARACAAGCSATSRSIAMATRR